MDVAKLVWGLRALLNAPFFKRIGMPSYLGKPTYISGRRRISIGKRVRIFPGLRMEAIGKGTIQIGDNVSIGQNLHLISTKADLCIGDNTTISGNVLITNTNHSYQEIDQHIMQQESIFKKTTIGPNCFIGYGAVIQAGTILGKQCIVGANAVVYGCFPDCSVIAGVPAKRIKQYCFETCTWDKVAKK